MSSMLAAPPKLIHPGRVAVKLQSLVQGEGGYAVSAHDLIAQILQLLPS